MIIFFNPQISLELTRTVSTPESSQTDSDDVSPQIHRKRKTGHNRDILPKFSISVEDEHSGIETGTSSSENNRELSPIGRAVQPAVVTATKHRSRSVVKSASASGLSLMIPSGKNKYLLINDPIISCSSSVGVEVIIRSNNYLCIAILFHTVLFTILIVFVQLFYCFCSFDCLFLFSFMRLI